MMNKKEVRRLIRERKKDYSEAQFEEMSSVIIARIRELPCYRDAETVFAYMDMPGEVKMREFIRGCWTDGKKVAVPRIIPDSVISYRRGTALFGERKEAPSEEKKAGTGKAAQEMRFYQITSFDELEEGTMHILEPDPEQCPCLDAEEHALVIMPGAAFDRERNRIGYGGGFYDRYLAAHPEHPTVAAAYSFQVFDRIPSDEHDIRPQILVTEEDQ